MRIFSFLANFSFLSIIYLKPKVTIQFIFIHITDFCWVKFEKCFNDVQEQSFVHTFVEPFLSNRLSKVSLSKQKGSKSKVISFTFGRSLYLKDSFISGESALLA